MEKSQVPGQHLTEHMVSIYSFDSNQFFFCICSSEIRAHFKVIIEIILPVKVVIFRCHFRFSLDLNVSNGRTICLHILNHFCFSLSLSLSKKNILKV